MKLRHLLVLITVIIIFVSIAVFSILQKHVPANPPGTIGNTAGNLSLGGSFCEDEGVVYFSNPYDNNALYSMNPDETNLKKLNSASCSSINAAGRYLYCYQGGSGSLSGIASMLAATGVFRISKDGKTSVCLDRGKIPSLSLADNTIFYQSYTVKEGTSLMRIGTNRSDKTVLTDYAADPACVSGGTVYFANASDAMKLYTVSTTDTSPSRIDDQRLFQPVIDSGYLYYMDVDNDYILCRRPLSGGESKIVVSERIDYYNIGSGIIFYQQNDTKGHMSLRRCALDGTGDELIAAGAFSDLQLTSRYAYFKIYGEDGTLYHVPLFSQGPMTKFVPR